MRERPLQVVGTVNAFCALLAEQVGFRALYLSGSGVASASYGLPDLGITCLADVVEDVRRITSASALPLLVDADTGWGGAFMIARTVQELTRAGVAGMRLEDQVQARRCGHRLGKAFNVESFKTSGTNPGRNGVNARSSSPRLRRIHSTFLFEKQNI